MLSGNRDGGDVASRRRSGSRMDRATKEVEDDGAGKEVGR